MFGEPFGDSSALPTYYLARETRYYVKKVFTNAWYYHHRLTGKTANLHEMLGQVRGRAGDASVAAAIP